MKLLKKILKYILLLSLIFIAWMEFLLRIKGDYYTYPEIAEGKYVTYYNVRIKGAYHVWPPGQKINIHRTEFNYPYLANSLGLREVELTEQTDSCRILFLGDSFTEGVGTSYDSSYPRLLGNRLKEIYNRKIQIINAGTSGSDPFYCYRLFADKLVKYHPSLVVIAINSDDINDYIYRGGMERFRPDGTVQFRKGPWWEQLYRLSHLVRYYIHTVLKYNAVFIKPDEILKMNNEAREAITGCLIEFDRLCKKNGIDFLTVIHPFPNELKAGTMTLNEIIPLALRLDSLGIMNVAIHPQMQRYINPGNINNFYWQKDTHYNSKGYAVFARAVEECIESKYFGFLKSCCE